MRDIEYSTRDIEKMLNRRSVLVNRRTVLANKLTGLEKRVVKTYLDTFVRTVPVTRENKYNALQYAKDMSNYTVYDYMTPIEVIQQWIDEGDYLAPSLIENNSIIDKHGNEEIDYEGILIDLKQLGYTHFWEDSQGTLVLYG